MDRKTESLQAWFSRQLADRSNHPKTLLFADLPAARQQTIFGSMALRCDEVALVYSFFDLTNWLAITTQRLFLCSNGNLSFLGHEDIVRTGRTMQLSDPRLPVNQFAYFDNGEMRLTREVPEAKHRSENNPITQSPWFFIQTKSGEFIDIRIEEGRIADTISLGLGQAVNNNAAT